MSESARVTSIAALQEFQAALAGFCEEAGDALCAVDLEVRRTLDWLERDRMYHWQMAVRHWREKVAQAANDLNRLKLARISGEMPDMTEQREALREARERLEEAEEKVEKIRRWLRVVQRAMDEYRGPARQLADLVEGDPPQSIALMDRIIASLDSYVMLAPAPDPAAMPASGPPAATAPISSASDPAHAPAAANEDASNSASGRAQGG